jgi:hypothetical protein
MDELREEFVKTILTFIDIGQLQVEEGKGDLLILAGELEGARVLLERLEQRYPSKKAYQVLSLGHGTTYLELLEFSLALYDAL